MKTLLNHTKIISKPFSVSSCHFHSFLFTLFIPKCLSQFKCLAHIPLLCLSPNIIPRQVQLLSHNRVCLLVLVSGQPFSSLHHFLPFVNLFPSAYTVRFQRSLPLISFPLQHSLLRCILNLCCAFTCLQKTKPQQPNQSVFSSFSPLKEIKQRKKCIAGPGCQETMGPRFKQLFTSFYLLPSFSLFPFPSLLPLSALRRFTLSVYCPIILSPTIWQTKREDRAKMNRD